MGIAPLPYVIYLSQQLQELVLLKRPGSQLKRIQHKLRESNKPTARREIKLLLKYNVPFPSNFTAALRQTQQSHHTTEEPILVGMEGIPEEIFVSILDFVWEETYSRDLVPYVTVSR